MARSVDTEPFRKFADFIAEIKPRHAGQDLAGETKHYVPLSALREHWTPSRISRVLRAFPGNPLNINVGVIREHYLRIFSTLVYANDDAVQSLQPLFISHNLTDNSGPWRSRPSSWPDANFHRNFFKEIAPHQWQFFPLHFRPAELQDRILADEHILPIDPPIPIRQSITTVEKFDIHAGFNSLVRRDEHGEPTKNTFVFKLYHSKRYEESYENELAALRRLNVLPSENVVKFYGSFRQLGSHALILEYVDGGDLGEFFDSCPMPITPGDVQLFWRSLFRVLAGLDRIHQLMEYNDDQVIKGIHQDIRPENILLMKGSSGSRYDFTPKIADFGLYSRVRTAKAKSSGSMGLDNNGAQRFSSPECCHHTIQRHKGTNLISTRADIFSMGAVLSHTAAWVIGGKDEQKTYFKSRLAHHEAKYPRFLGSGYEGCFHDSIKPLPVVQEHHKMFRERCEASNDCVTPEVLRWVEECMLVESPKQRQRARVVLEKFEQLMDHMCNAAPPLPPPPQPSASPIEDPPTGVSEMTTPSPLFSEAAPSPSTLDGASPPPTTPLDVGLGSVCVPLSETKESPPADASLRLSGSAQLQRDGSGSTLHHDTSISISQAPDTTPSASQTQQASTPPTNVTDSSLTTNSGPRISDIHRYQVERREGNPVDDATSHLVDYLEHNLGGRDQFFFIDDSRTMRAEKDTIYDGFRALACIAKRLDPNHVELAFASRPLKVHKAKRTKRLRDLVKNCEYRGEGHLMEDRLGDLIDRVIIPRLPLKLFGVNVNVFARKKVSIYVLTDGAWGDVNKRGNACGVERPVKRLIEELKRRRLDRTQVSLHFVRFGDMENGKQHLDRLDDCGIPDDMDIVDVKHINTDVEGMIMGPLTRWNDDKASEAT